MDNENIQVNTNPVPENNASGIYYNQTPATNGMINSVQPVMMNNDPTDYTQCHRSSFNTTIVEKIISILILPASYFFVEGSWFSDYSLDRMIVHSIFVLLLIVSGEVLFWNRKRTVESFMFLVMTLSGLVSLSFNIGQVWDRDTVAFFNTLFLFYWMLSRSGRLAEGKTSHMLVWDGITAFFVMPFKNFILDIRTITTVFRKKKGNGKKVLASFIGAIVGLILLIIAIAFLRDANDSFDALMREMLKNIQFKRYWILKSFLTLHVASYLYGILGGCFRESEEQTRNRGSIIANGIEKLKKVPYGVWIGMICLFSVFYITFFFLQGKDMYDAFMMVLPEDLTYSQYAIGGFRDMCWVMVINFLLLWLATRTADNCSKAVTVSAAVLICESVLFAVVAMLKLQMYINAYGFTQKRVQSMWLIGVLLYACICSFISLVGKKKTAAIWFIPSAASLAATCLIYWN